MSADPDPSISEQTKPFKHLEREIEVQSVEHYFDSAVLAVVTTVVTDIFVNTIPSASVFNIMASNALEGHVPQLRGRYGEGSSPIAIVPIWYATDRRPSGDTKPDRFFTADRCDLSFGKAEITIPVDRHRMGELERPNFWRLEFTEHPARHVILRSVTPQREGAFFEGLRRRVEQDEYKQAFVFIHGYNTSFKEAARRAGQIAWDLDFSGVPILYSWPSLGRVSKYPIDSSNASWTVHHLNDL